MFIIVAIIASTAGPLAQMRSRDAFPTMATCEAALAADRPSLDRVAESLTADLGRPVVVVARCVALRQDAAA